MRTSASASRPLNSYRKPCQVMALANSECSLPIALPGKIDVALSQRHSLVVFAIRIKLPDLLIECSEFFRALGLFADGEGAFRQRFGIGVAALGLIQGGEVA